jgi:hypothetical protein
MEKCVPTCMIECALVEQSHEMANGEAQDTAWERLDARYPVRRMRTRRGLELLAFVASFAFLHAVLMDGGVLDAVLGGVWLWSALLLSVVAHELGHVLGARAAGLRPFILVAGGGPSLLLREVAGVAVDLGMLPGNGLTLMATSDLGPRVKWRLFVAYASGPVVSALLFAASLFGFPAEWEGFSDGGDPSIGPIPALVLANGLLLFTSIVPLPRGNEIGTPRNDLLQIFKLPSLKGSTLAALARADRAATTSRLFQLRQYRAAYEEGRRCLANKPQDWPVQLQLAEMLLFARRYPEAAREYAAVLAEPAFIAECSEPIGVALLNNNCAWADFMHGSQEALEAADSTSLKAITAFPKNPHFLGTRGAVLVASGRVEKGRALLNQALSLHRDARSRASVLACLALAAAVTAQDSEARRLLDSALKLDPDLELRSRIERTLGTLLHSNSQNSLTPQ